MTAVESAEDALHWSAEGLKPLTSSHTARTISPEAIQMLAQMYPHSAAVAAIRRHEQPSVIGSGCGDQFEFEFALDIVLDGLERLHRHPPCAARAGKPHLRVQPGALPTTRSVPVTVPPAAQVGIVCRGRCVSLSMSLVLEPGSIQHDAEDDPGTERGVTERICASA